MKAWFEILHVPTSEQHWPHPIICYNKSHLNLYKKLITTWYNKIKKEWN